VTTQHTEHEHNEAHNTHSVEEVIVEQQYIPETSVIGTPSSNEDEATSDTSVSHDDTASAVVAYNDEATSTEDVEPEKVAFAEETGNTIPELSTFVSVEDLQAPTTQEQTVYTSSAQEETPWATTENVQTPIAQEEVPASETTSEVQTPVTQEKALSERTEPVEESIPLLVQAEPNAPETIDAAAAPVFVEESETVTSEIAPLTEANKEEVRPFTSFIEEFHQAQAEAEAQAEAHLTASLQGSQAEEFAEFATPEADVTAVDQPISLEEALPPVDFGEGSAFVPKSNDATTVDVAEVNPQFLTEAAIHEENQRIEAVAEMSQEEDATPVVQRTERPISPLLRPALRPRPARHAAIRHRDEPAASTASPTSVATTRETTEAETQATQEAPVAPEQPSEAKPPRRYRFDRRGPQVAQTAASSKPVQAAPATVNNSVVLTPPPAAQPTPTFVRVEESQTPSAKVPTISAPSTSTVGTPDQQSVESTSTESTTTVSSPIEQGRRRHGSERQERQQREKEQVATSPVVAPASVADIATALVSESKAEEVAPEDMPPLEYADLQKANSSRRRRRHRTSTPSAPAAKENAVNTNGSQPVAPVQPEAPLAQNVAPVKPAASTAPATSPYSSSNGTPPASAANPYTIVSGYTVGQMNQGNEESGPFMGPEPSPARGSVVTTRDGRTARAESQPQRTSASYQTRSSEGALPAVSMNHFANIVSQAIQTQTDRMVSELRRANQAPTNVSVSLPPFPSTERVGVFVDVANLLYSARTQRIAIDFGKLLDFLRGNRRLVRAHAYCPTSPQPGDEQMFLTAVKGLGYRITTKNYKTFASGAKKADLDLDLCMDVVRIVDGGAVDCIVLVSGDSDFMPMLDYCSDHGVRVEVAAFDEAMSITLRQSCDLFVNLSMLEEIRA